MRVVMRVYRDGHTKPHHDEYKTDCEDERSIQDTVSDLQSFLEEAYAELEDTDEGDWVDSSDKE